MKYTGIKANDAAGIPTYVRQLLPAGPAGDRSTGISVERATLAATRNVVDGGISPARVAAMAANYIEAANGDKANRLPQRLTGIAARSWRDHFEAGAYQPHRTIRGDVDHVAYVRHLLSPSANAAVLGTIVETLLGTSVDRHAEDLDKVRDDSQKARDDAYDLIIRGKLGVAMNEAREGRCAKHDPAELKRTVRNHARCYAIRTAHKKIESLREQSRAPFGDRFAGFSQWYLVGHSILATMASPAASIHRLCAANAAGLFDDVDDDATVAQLFDSGLLPRTPEGAQIFEIAQLVRRTLRSRRQGRDYDLSAVLNYVQRGCDLAFRLNRGDMKRDSLSRMDFAEHRTGLAASEGAAFVALELHRTFRHIEICIEAILASKPLPAVPVVSIIKKSLAFHSVMLRAEGRPDRNAPLSSFKVGKGVFEFDKVRGSGRTPMSDMLEKLGDREIQARAAESLGFNAAVWFGN